MFKSVLGRLVHHLFCFDDLCVLFLSPRLSQGFQKKKRQGGTTVETLRARQDNLLGWSLWPPLWHFMERQPVVMGLPGMHISILALMQFLSLGSLIIYPWSANLPHDSFTAKGGHNKKARGQNGEEGCEKCPELHSHSTSPFRNEKNICSVRCDLNCVGRENRCLYLPL